MEIIARNLHLKSRPDSDLELTVDAGWRDIGRIIRVGRRWFARFEVPGRDPFEQDFTSRKAAISWMQTEADAYSDMLASSPGFTSFSVVATRNGMHAGDLADLVDFLTSEGCPVIIPTGIWERNPEYYVLHSNESHKHGYLAYVGPSRRASRIRGQMFLIEDSDTADRLIAAHPRDAVLLGKVALRPSAKNDCTIAEARARLIEDRERILSS